MMRGGGGGCSENHYSVMNRIMLKFRPIAPKPSEASAAADLEKTNVSDVKNGRRTKRKYVRVRGRQSSKRKSRSEEKSGVDDPEEEKVVVKTLQLLPSESSSSSSYNNNNIYSGGGLSETDHRNYYDEVSYNRKAAAAAADNGVNVVRSVTKTWIAVECVTEVVSSGLGLGVSDWEKISNLQGDTCPGFVSDGSNNVVWVNEAYRKLVGGGAENGGGVMAWLVVKEKLPYLAPAFACRVRMIQQTKHGHKWNRIVPCDVWRMDFPGFAWKLDVKTALGLGI